MSESKKVVTRFAPSPTGYLHIGGYRTAIFAYLHAKKNGGDFILRIEDTDKERNKKEYEDNILESLKWIGLEYDKFYRQSENIERHKKVIQDLITNGHAYISKEEAKDASGVIKEIIRFKNPNKVVTIHDLIKGEVKIDTTDLGDFVIARNINDPIFHLAVVIDDFDEGVTHVIRGDEHLSNTPRQILVLEALGAPIPTYAHIPLVLDTEKKKLSKRKGALPLTDYRDLGYLPEAILNTAVLVGWNPGGEQEIFTKDELIKIFDISRVQHAGAVFNVEKLNWVNKEHMKLMPKDELEGEIIKWLPEGINKKVIPIIADRISYFGEIKKLIDDGELDYYMNRPEYNIEKLIWKGSDKEKTIKHLEKVTELINGVTDESMDGFKNAIWPYAEEVGRGDVLWPLRYALSGKDKSPDPFTIASILGKQEVLERVKIALEKLKG